MLRRNFASRGALLLAAVPATTTPAESVTTPANDLYSPRYIQRNSIAQNIEARREYVAIEAEKQQVERPLWERIWNPQFSLQHGVDHGNRVAILTWRDFMGKEFWYLAALFTFCMSATIGMYMWGVYFKDAAKQYTDDPRLPNNIRQ